MRLPTLFAVLLAALFVAPVAAQQDTTRCATVTVSRATEADIPGLLADAECYAKALQSAANSQALRLKKARELAEAEPAAEADPGEHDSHEMSEPPAFVPLTINDIRPIEDGIDVAKWLEPAPIPSSMAPDMVGAFRFICNVSHYSYDDPIAYPGQPGAAHLHAFFGNTKADAHSTYASLRSGGDSSCQVGPPNRSAYWVPAMLTKAEGGQIVQPNAVSLYYKREPETAAECTRAPHQRCAGIPAGLRAIFGTNYTQGHNQSPHVRFDCNTKPSRDNWADAVADCPGAPEMYARIEAPDCWDGVNLDSEDHQSHLAYRSRDLNTGRPMCPVTHPVIIPKLEMGVVYAVLPGDTPATWIFSSDVQAGKRAGTTFHADYMEAWNDAIRLRWESHCINKLLNCAGGVMGDGTLGKAPTGFTFTQRPHLLPVPERP